MTAVQYRVLGALEVSYLSVLMSRGELDVLSAGAKSPTAARRSHRCVRTQHQYAR
ncbi:hypothetical protein [Kitasatospora sp. GP82]|uniref:hypothetical protein n=1 Tax=Kitasatospora sp. GP82 TaxID=3035089 RepID=UPI0024747DF0|nr:hypothetical protein [Kitasatospora sp. GP82]MDH6127945.1 hypothetical protein [Kitasatospora sp. GP82]